VVRQRQQAAKNRSKENHIRTFHAACSLMSGTYVQNNISGKVCQQPDYGKPRFLLEPGEHIEGVGTAWQIHR
jgi:hypothetical protein